MTSAAITPQCTLLVVATDGYDSQGNTREEANKVHDDTVLDLMSKVWEHNLTLNFGKLQKITFMGHIQSESGISPDPSMVSAIANMPKPEDKAAVLIFCGIVNYLGQFRPNLSKTMRPLFGITKADHEFI